AEAHVLVAVEANLCVAAQLSDQRRNAVRGIIQDRRAGRVHHVNSLAPCISHNACLLGKFFGVMRWLSIRKPTVSMPSLRACWKCWIETSASVQWVAIRATDAPTSW